MKIKPSLNWSIGVTLALKIAFATVHIGPAHAQVAEAQQIIDALKPDPVPPRLKTRGLRNLQVEQVAESADTPAPPKFVSLTVGFKFDSSEVTPESANTLDTLAQALKSHELSGLEFMIEGHTDGKGSREYNLRLSQLRAAAVRAYLIRLGVDGKRLQSQGKGDSELINPKDPFAAENRRVKILAWSR